MTRPPHSNTPFVFLLTMQIPSGKNMVMTTRTGHRYPNTRFKAWRQEAIAQINLAAAEGASFQGPVSLTVEYTPGDHIRRDVPGLLDALCHLIEKTSILADDAQVKRVAWTTRSVQPKRPRCWVTVTPLADTEGVR